MAPSTLFSAILAFTSLALTSTATPVVRREDGSNWDSWTTSTTPVPYTSPTPIPVVGPTTIFPSFTSQYHVKTGAVDYNSNIGQVFKSPTNNGADITTLVTFEVDAMYSGRQCQLVFDLATGGSSYVAGTGKVQVFTSLAPATQSASGWPSGNLRDQMLGTLDVAYGRASWEAGSGPGATVQGVFDCSTVAGRVYGGEIVGQGDYDDILWVVGVDGPKIIVL
jgi:hypothetical protein